MMKVLAKNRKAKFEYHIIETITAGLKLYGTEVKSLRAGKGSIAESHCIFQDGELFVKNMHIAEWSHGNRNNHEPQRMRKLLLKKKELRKLEKKVAEKGLTIVPLNIHVAKSGYIKLEIALVKGKKLYDKRQDIKKRDLEREEQRKF